MKRQVWRWKISSYCLRESWKCCSALLPPSVGSAPILPEYLLAEPELLGFSAAFRKTGGFGSHVSLFFHHSYISRVFFLQKTLRLNVPSHVLYVDPLPQDWLCVLCNSRQAKSCDLVNWIKFMLE